MFVLKKNICCRCKNVVNFNQNEVVRFLQQNFRNRTHITVEIDDILVKLFSNARFHRHIVRLQNEGLLSDSRDETVPRPIKSLSPCSKPCTTRRGYKSTTGEIIERGLFRRLGTTLPINNSRKRLPHISRPDKQYISVGDSSIRGRSCRCVVIIVVVTRQTFYARLFPPVKG